MNIDKLSSQNIQLVGLKATQSIKDVYVDVYLYINCVYIIVHILVYSLFIYCIISTKNLSIN